MREGTSIFYVHAYLSLGARRSHSTDPVRRGSLPRCQTPSQADWEAFLVRVGEEEWEWIFLLARGNGRPRASSLVTSPDDCPVSLGPKESFQSPHGDFMFIVIIVHGSNKARIVFGKALTFSMWTVLQLRMHTATCHATLCQGRWPTPSTWRSS